MKFIKRLDISVLFWVPLFIGILFLVLIVIFESHGYHNYHLNLFFEAMFYFFLGVSGVPIIVRREFPRRVFYFSENVAMGSGIIISLFGFGNFIFVLGQLTNIIK